MHSLSFRALFFKILAFSSFISSCVGIAIDDPKCICKVMASQNQSCNPNFVPSVLQANLSTCAEICGASWDYYDFWDIQMRIAAWIVPLFILIGLAQFAPFRRRNTAAVVLHLLGDPISSTAHLLWKLQNTREYYLECQERV